MTAIHWRKSTYSSSGNACVELADLGDTIAVRNSNHPDAGTLTLKGDQIAALIDSVKTGEFDQDT